MLLATIVKTKIYNSNIRFYKNKYKCKTGDLINIFIKDIPKQSHTLIEWECDYCKREQPLKRYCDYIKQNKDRITHKDCCEKCKIHKIEESNMIKYNVNNVMKVDEIHNKQKQSCINNIGVPYPYQNKDIVKNVLIKAKHTMYLEGNAPCSKQQRYLHNILGGELNYPINTLNLDIAFPKEKIYIEYDGGGHDLQVKFGHITYKEQRSKQRRREYLLQLKGWKLIRIVSGKDKLPYKQNVINLIHKAKEYLNKGHSWCEINIDNKTLNGTDMLYNFNIECVSIIHNDYINKAI